MILKSLKFPGSFQDQPLLVINTHIYMFGCNAQVTIPTGHDYHPFTQIYSENHFVRHEEQQGNHYTG